MSIPDPLRLQLARMLDWEEARVGFDNAIDGIPADKRGALAPCFERSIWQLLEHLRLAQDRMKYYRGPRLTKDPLSDPDPEALPRFDRAD